MEAKVMAQQLRAHAILAEDLIWLLEPTMVAYNHM